MSFFKNSSDNFFRMAAGVSQLEAMGNERFLQDIGARKIQQDDFGELYYKRVGGISEPIAMIKVRNSTPEPDGTWRYYYLRVPPETATAKDGVAWTFGLTADEYSPLVES